MPTLFLVHAHPDDEAISTGGVMCRAARAGHRVVLVTCTRGEEGEIHNMDPETARPRLAEIRTAELAHACQILGVDRQVFLGYRDSGMAGAATNSHPNAFVAAPIDEAAGRLAGLLAEERPEVVVTYTADGTYGHPDHVRAYEITIAALALLETEGWRPARVYLQGLPQSVLDTLPTRSGRPRRRRLGIPAGEITTVVDVGEFVPDKLAAFAAHASQNAPGLFDTPMGKVIGGSLDTEVFVRHRGPANHGTTGPETDLFAGLPR